MKPFIYPNMRSLSALRRYDSDIISEGTFPLASVIRKHASSDTQLYNLVNLRESVYKIIDNSRYIWFHDGETQRWLISEISQRLPRVYDEDFFLWIASCQVSTKALWDRSARPHRDDSAYVSEMDMKRLYSLEKTMSRFF
jgi:hypothetical protein